MKIRESLVWWIIVLLCLLPSLLKTVIPVLGAHEIYPEVQLFSFGVIISIAVGATIAVKSPLDGLAERISHVKTRNLLGREKVSRVIDYKTFVNQQIRVALALSFVLWGFFLFFFVKCLFDKFVAIWLLVPISFLGPVLHVREIVKRKMKGSR